MNQETIDTILGGIQPEHVLSIGQMDQLKQKGCILLTNAFERTIAYDQGDLVVIAQPLFTPGVPGEPVLAGYLVTNVRASLYSRKYPREGSPKPHAISPS